MADDGGSGGKLQRFLAWLGVYLVLPAAAIYVAVNGYALHSAGTGVGLVMMVASVVLPVFVLAALDKTKAQGAEAATFVVRLLYERCSKTSWHLLAGIWAVSLGAVVLAGCFGTRGLHAVHVDCGNAYEVRLKPHVGLADQIVRCESSTKTRAGERVVTVEKQWLPGASPSAASAHVKCVYAQQVRRPPSCAVPRDATELDDAVLSCPSCIGEDCVQSEACGIDGGASPPLNAWITVRVSTGGSRFIGQPPSSRQRGLSFDRHVEVPTQEYDLQEHEVTWAELAVLATNPTVSSWVARHRDKRADDVPVTGISWELAATYCASIGGRLPSEAEWEFAARGPRLLASPASASLTAHDGGSGYLHAYAGANAVPRAVKSTNADVVEVSGHRLFDMTGNAREWVDASTWLPDSPDEDKDWSEFDRAQFRPVRGLPLREARPDVLPAMPLVYREQRYAWSCDDRACIPGIEVALADVGFRCARRAGGSERQ